MKKKKNIFKQEIKSRKIETYGSGIIVNIIIINLFCGEKKLTCFFSSVFKAKLCDIVYGTRFRNVMFFLAKFYLIFAVMSFNDARTKGAFIFKKLHDSDL